MKKVANRRSFFAALVVSLWAVSLVHGADLARDLDFVRREGGPAYGGKTIECLIRGDWKLVQDSPFQPLELYNLKSDPRETTNRAAQEKKTFLELSAALRQRIQQGGQVPWQEP